MSGASHTVNAKIYSGDDAPGIDPYFESNALATVKTIKSSPGRLYALEVYNITTSDAFVQFFDQADNVTVGTSTPKLSFLIPAGTGTLRGGNSLVLPVPITFAHSIRYAATTTPTSSSAPGTGLVVNALYK